MIAGSQPCCPKRKTLIHKDLEIDAEEGDVKANAILSNVLERWKSLVSYSATRMSSVCSSVAQWNHGLKRFSDYRNPADKAGLIVVQMPELQFLHCLHNA